jgi:hypothetical protein
MWVETHKRCRSMLLEMITKTSKGEYVSVFSQFVEGRKYEVDKRGKESRLFQSSLLKNILVSPLYHENSRNKIPSCEASDQL